MRCALVFAALIAACGDDHPAIDARPADAKPIDAGIDSTVTTFDAAPINFSEWGSACDTSIVVLHSCQSTMGETGWCVIDEPHNETSPGVFAGKCRPACCFCGGHNPPVCPSNATCVTSSMSQDWCQEN